MYSTQGICPWSGTMGSPGYSSNASWYLLQCSTIWHNSSTYMYKGALICPHCATFAWGLVLFPVIRVSGWGNERLVIKVNCRVSTPSAACISILKCTVYIFTTWCDISSPFRYSQVWHCLIFSSVPSMHFPGSSMASWRPGSLPRECSSFFSWRR